MKKEDALLLDDPQLKDQYQDFLGKSLRYVVTSVRFLSFFTSRERSIKPYYLPYHFVAGFNTNYDDVLNRACLLKMDKDYPDSDLDLKNHPYVRKRAKNGLSMRAVDAYREVFDGNDEYVNKVMPVHLPLTANFKPETEKYYHPLHSEANARLFIERAGTKTYPSVEQKKKRMIFYAKTFGSQVYHKFNGKTDLERFNDAIQQNCEAITDVAAAYRGMASRLEPYVIA